MARDDIPSAPADKSSEGRQRLMKLCAHATAAELDAAMTALGGNPAHELLRAPEVGLVMLRGRIGGDGAPFNAGEASVTRAVVRLASGEMGFAYLLGRAPEKARIAALVDAIAQSPAMAARVEETLLKIVASRVERERAGRRAETAATRVQFFTLVRGED